MSAVCRVISEGVRCGAEAHYQVTFPACPYCFNAGLPGCRGHSACNDHATTLRTGMWKTRLPDTLLDDLPINPNQVRLVRPRNREGVT